MTTTAPRRVLRWTIPVDDQWHRLTFDGSLVHVASRDAAHVEVWTTENVIEHHVDTGAATFISARYETAPPSSRAYEYRVFGTGQPVEGLYVGTAPAEFGLVWHLFRREVTP